MFLYAFSALPGVVQQLSVCQSRGMVYVFPRAQLNVLFMFSITYLRIVIVFLVSFIFIQVRV
jgi:uncharacterized membrane protein (UPF0127 family)